MHEGDMPRLRKVILRSLLCLLFILFGVAVKIVLTVLREPPKQAAISEMRLSVEVTPARPEDVPVTISGYGEARALNVVSVTPKVAGKIVELHPRLETGEVIPAGELLYRIDQRDYRAAVAQAQAQVDRLTNAISLLNKQYQIDTGRLETARRTRDLALQEFERDKKLYEEEDVGSETIVNYSEINYRKAQDVFEQADEGITLYPMRIKEAEIGLEAAKAALEMATLSLERTEEYAPFNARVKQVQLEVGQAVAPGMPVLTLADDSVLELSVPLDSNDARAWLPFKSAPSLPAIADANWFGELEPAPCNIRWTEDPEGHVWCGVLNRVERFDQMTRTVSVAVRVDKETGSPDARGLPLVEGMFCQVDISGRVMQQVYRLPRWSVSFEGIVNIVEDNRLQRRQVEILRNEGDETFVRGGLNPGDLIIVTRLVNPLPGTIVDYTASAPQADSAP